MEVQRTMIVNEEIYFKLKGAKLNTNGHWETRLNCPECGCWKIDLNDIAEKEGYRN